MSIVPVKTTKKVTTKTTKAKEKAYESIAKITVIAATSRASVKIKDNYFTVEYHEERAIPDVTGVDIEKERQFLWDTVNAECDNQIDEISRTFK